MRNGKKQDREFLDRLQAVTWNRRFMFTCDGRMGIVPAGAEIDDRICLLWGCSVPVVLRPLTKNIMETFYEEKKGAESTKTFMNRNVEVYELIGPCYVHGVMNGEPLKECPDLRDPHSSAGGKALTQKYWFWPRGEYEVPACMKVC